MVFGWKEEEGRGGYACWRRISRIVSPFVPAFAYRSYAVRSELFCHASQNKVHLRSYVLIKDDDNLAQSDNDFWKTILAVRLRYNYYLEI